MLDDRKRQLADMIIVGVPQQNAATHLDISRVTAWRWLQDPEVQAYIATLDEQATDERRRVWQAALNRASLRLRAALDDPDTCMAAIKITFGREIAMARIRGRGDQPGVYRSIYEDDVKRPLEEHEYRDTAGRRRIYVGRLREILWAKNHSINRYSTEGFERMKADHERLLENIGRTQAILEDLHEQIQEEGTDETI